MVRAIGSGNFVIQPLDPALKLLQSPILFPDPLGQLALVLGNFGIQRTVLVLGTQAVQFVLEFGNPAFTSADPLFEPALEPQDS